MMRITSKWMAVAACTAAVGLSTLAGGCGPSKMSAEQKQEAMMKAPGDIIDTATGPHMEDVTTVVELIKIAGLVDTLRATSAPAPFTVFAPTNDAFKALGQPALDDLKKPENHEKLKATLLYHVHPGQAILAADASAMQLSTADGDKMLNVSVNGGTVMVNDAKVVKPDIICKNGVIHWVDKVLMPPAMTDMSSMPSMGGMNH